jgi:ATP-dependent Lon protease
VLTRKLLEEILGIPRYATTEAESSPEIGVVTGLAWTASGGELMFIEALRMAGTGRLIITGMLGEVMRESVSAAYSYVRSRAGMLGISEIFPASRSAHSLPGGCHAEGRSFRRSGGDARDRVVAFGSPVRHDIAMTGEVTLRGKILEIGGVKEKILAAYRAVLREVMLPAGNERDLRDVPPDVREGMRFHFVQQMDEVFRIALLEKHPVRRGARAGSGRKIPKEASAATAKEAERRED